MDDPEVVEGESREWRCFHCDEVFTDHDCAAAHFGCNEICEPACRIAASEVGLVGLVREQEDELRRFRQEDTASCREFYTLGAEHSSAVRTAEEQGYARALRDVEAGKVESDHASRILATLRARSGAEGE